jgi:uncharacterized protein YxeA
MKKKALVTVISIVLVTIGVLYYISYKKEKEIQAYNIQVEDFEYSLKEIGSQTPEEVNSYTLERYQQASVLIRTRSDEVFLRE